MQTRESHRSPHVLVRLDSFDQFWNRVALADLPFFWKSFKIHSLATILWSLSSSRLHPFGLFSNHPVYLIAHNPQLPDSFESWISGWHPHWDTQRSQLMAHCRRELVQAVWKYILDDDFLHAMKYGVVITCHDGVRRRIYPRIFTYSADYPEK